MILNSLKKWVGPSGLFLLVLVMTACGEVASCPGGGDTGSCLRIDSITPTYNKKDSSNVDVVQGPCDVTGTSTATSTATSTPKLEEFFDHRVKIVFSNMPVPGKVVRPEDITDIILGGYSIEYKLNHCPGGAGTCPALTKFEAVDPNTFKVPANGTLTTDGYFQLLSLAKKDEYFRAKIGLFGDYPSYTAVYTFNGRDAFGNLVSAQGATEFTIGNYDTCKST
ncbi:MAG: hypothetical protein AAB035_06030 [Nitrospirota bacterium]